MTEEYQGIVVFIPTRNRARLAIMAIESVLSQRMQDVSVLVSDNSTVEQEVDELAQFCEGVSDERLRYIRPSAPLPMPKHFDWVIQQALELYDANHFTCLTDRLMLKPGALGEMKCLSKLYSNKVICYKEDILFDDRNPVFLWQPPWTGRILEVDSEYLLCLASKCMGLLDTPVPKVGLNCLIPRSAFQAVHDRFGDICLTLSPDFGFAYRCLEVIDSLVVYDKALRIQYGVSHSNGWSFFKGISTPAYRDYIANMGQKLSFFASPIPEMLTVDNGVIHEYCLVKKVTNSPKLPDLDKDGYFKALADGISKLEDPEFKRNMQALLVEYGWQEPNSLPAVHCEPFKKRMFSAARNMLSPRKVCRKVLRRINEVARRFNRTLRELLKSNYFKPIWLYLADRFGLNPPADNSFTFSTLERALDYAKRYTPKRQPGIEHLWWFKDHNNGPVRELTDHLPASEGV